MLVFLIAKDFRFHKVVNNWSRAGRREVVKLRQLFLDSGTLT
jgi:hypothetical protein